MSGPLLDRLDLHVEVPALSFDELSASRGGEPSARVRERVAAARSVQLARAGRCNGVLGAAEIRRLVELTPDARALLAHAVDHLGISGRAHDRVLKVALTIRDLALGGDGQGRVRLTRSHVAEALSYRLFDRATGPVVAPPVPGRPGARARSSS